MRYFIFRNQTIEPFFSDKDVAFSGYGDISVIPDADLFVWFYLPSLTADAELLVQEIGTYYDRLQLVLQNLPENSQIIILTLEALNYVPITGDDFNVRTAINDFNAKVIVLAKNDNRVKIADFSEFTSRYAMVQLVNWKFYFISQSVLNPKLAKDFKVWWTRKLDELILNRKKCLVLDLDNTLWGGILGEDGITGIAVGGDYPGNAFAFWQQSLLQLKNSGVMLAVCSKNNEDDVLEVWEKNPYLVLRKDDFVAWRINWQDKVSNIQDLAEELNIGLDSMVFVDDNPTERELMRQALPMVAVPEFSGKPYDLMPLFNDLVNKYFRIYTITDDDKTKTKQYQDNAKRKASQASFVNMDDYLRSLDMCICIMPVDDFNRSRIAQLTQKTNQFNLTTCRYSESDIKKMEHDGWYIYCLKVSDKFGDNGITGAIILRPEEEATLAIDSLLLSCRILGKGIEYAFLNSVLNRLLEAGVKRVRAEYVKTRKNAMVADFYNHAGFALVDDKNEGEHRFYELILDEKNEIKPVYKITFI